MTLKKFMSARYRLNYLQPNVPILSSDNLAHVERGLIPTNIKPIFRDVNSISTEPFKILDASLHVYILHDIFEKPLHYLPNG